VRATFRFAATARETVDAESGVDPALAAVTGAEPSATDRALAATTAVRTPPIVSGIAGESAGST